MATFEIAAGETETVEAGQTEAGGPAYVDGTLNMDGTLFVGEETLAATAMSGATTTGSITGEASLEQISATAAAGSSAVASVAGEKATTGTIIAGAQTTASPSAAKAIIADAAAGGTSDTIVSGEKDVAANVVSGAITTTSIDSTIPLIRFNTFTVQGVGDVDGE